MGMKELGIDDFKDGVKSVFDGSEPAMSVEEAQKMIQDYLSDLQTKAEETAKAAGKQFLEENKKNADVRETASGLQYVVEKEGEGTSPARLLAGIVFDPSVNRGDPATFPLNRVIPGWTEGVQLMKEGAKYTFFIPSDLAYGPQGIPGAIPPHSTLVFEVELIKVIKK